MTPSDPLGVTVLSAREAVLRSAGAACLGGIALLQAIALPAVVDDDRALALLPFAAIAACLAAGSALAVAPARTARALWSVIAALSALVLTGWAATCAFALGPTPGAGHWTAMPGGAGAALAAACLVVAVIAAPPTRASVRAVAVAAAVLLALGPGIGALLVALRPGPAGGETALAAAAHVHPGGVGDANLEFRPVAGGRGGAFVYPTAATPGPTALSTTFLAAAALVFVAVAVGHLRRRVAGAAPARSP